MAKKFNRKWLMQQGAEWMNSKEIRPYIYLRKENQFRYPGRYLKSCDWFQNKPIYVNPLAMDTVGFADLILKLESKAFQKSGMPMPRWVFYDCAVVPGFVCGFAQRTRTLTPAVRALFQSDEEKGGSRSVDHSENSELHEWTPLSLFIIIPTLRRGEWVAHNLCTINSLVEDKDRLYALGFLSKAFGLWYANVETLCGMTQWQSPALRLHSHYGKFEILTAYTPVHSYAQTMTYRSRIRYEHWPLFFLEEKERELLSRQKRHKVVATIDRFNEDSMRSLQSRIENGGGPYYLNPKEIREWPLDAPLNVYRNA